MFLIDLFFSIDSIPYSVVRPQINLIFLPFFSQHLFFVYFQVAMHRIKYSLLPPYTRIFHFCFSFLFNFFVSHLFPFYFNMYYMKICNLLLNSCCEVWFGRIFFSTGFIHEIQTDSIEYSLYSIQLKFA